MAVSYVTTCIYLSPQAISVPFHFLPLWIQLLLPTRGIEFMRIYEWRSSGTNKYRVCKGYEKVELNFDFGSIVFYVFTKPSMVIWRQMFFWLQVVDCMIHWDSY